jgi:hypothetical protein
MTVPGGWLGVLSLVIVPIANPASVIALLASSRVIPVAVGTRTVAGAGAGVVTVDVVCTVVVRSTVCVGAPELTVSVTIVPGATDAAGGGD